MDEITLGSSAFVSYASQDVAVANSVVMGLEQLGLKRASSKQKQIIGFRIDNAALNPAFEYFLSESHWIDVPALGLLADVAGIAGHV
jgi:hypothetical protein